MNQSICLITSCRNRNGSIMPKKKGADYQFITNQNSALPHARRVAAFQLSLKSVSDENDVQLLTTS